jgi:hypothetical protein
MSLYFHYTIADSRNISSSLKLNLDFHTVKIKDLKAIAENGINTFSTNIKYKVLGLSKNFNSKDLDESLPVNLFFNSGEDIFVKVEVSSHVSVESQIKIQNNPEINKVSTKKAEVVEKKPLTTSNSTSTGISSSGVNTTSEDELTFKVIDKYIFYDDGNKFAKVVLNIPRIGDHPKENIISNFEENGFVIKILDYNGSNYRYGVTRLQYRCEPAECKVINKKDQLTIKLKKLKEGEYWSFLHKTKMIGDDK